MPRASDLPDEDALALKVVGAYRRVADERMADWFFDQVPWRTTAGPANLGNAVNTAKAGIARTRAQIDGAENLLRATQGEIRDIQTNALESALAAVKLGNAVKTTTNVAQEATRMRRAINQGLARVNKLSADAAKGVVQEREVMDRLTQLRQRLQRYRTRLEDLEPQWKQAVEEAQRVKFDEATISAPAFAGRILTGPQAKEIADTVTRSLSRKQNEALAKVNKVGAAVLPVWR